jgi:hypothetical protein
MVPNPQLSFLHFEVVVGLAWSNNPESYTGGSIATGRVSQAWQVQGDDSDKQKYPDPSGWGLRVGLTALPRKKLICYGYFTTASDREEWRHVVKKAEALHGL